MTNEEAIRRILEHMEHHKIGIYPHLKLAEALEMAISALHSANTGDPLTLEQLLVMDGKPVYIISKRFCISEWNVISGKEWITISYDGPLSGFKSVEEGIHFVNGRTLSIASYGTNWLAYRYHPTNIDLSQWVPFETIGGTKGVACKKCGYREYQHVKYSQFSFCPNCGRPMTEEARAELEKRLRGQERE